MKHESLVRKMTLEEKAALLSGRTVFETRAFPHLNIPSMFLADGPHGIRRQAGASDHLGLNASLPATCFPTAAAIANSWDESLGEDIGAALGEEAKAQRVHVLLGPGLNIKRSPLCGRNFEYFSEDPYLSGKLAAAYIRGIQKLGVAACPKHFAVNNQETRRMSMNAVVDERTLREIYLTAFEIAIKEGEARALMTAYNEVNGVYANENAHLLRDILRGEWGFDGLIVTDWGGSNDHVAGVRAGSDLEMPAPGFDSARQIVEAVKSGTLFETEVDECVDRVLEAALTLANADEPVDADIDWARHHSLAKRAACESAVLLKNDECILPLKPGTRVAIIGDYAIEPRYQGAGSSRINPPQVDTIEKLVGDYPLDVIGVARGYERSGAKNAKLFEQALALASEADITLYFFGLGELGDAEGVDRKNMRIPQQQIDLLEALNAAGNSVVGVISAGASIEMAWADCCQAILHGYLCGQAGAGAMLDILTGRANPSGKLAETYPLCYEDTPAYNYFPSAERNSEYREALYVGYRFFDINGVSVRYPFGYGLSYTTFEYGDLSVDENGVSFTIENTGAYNGAEIMQMYISLPNANVFRPQKELKGFAKAFLKPGETRRVHIPFDDKTFRYWNTLTNSWEIEGGKYSILIGASSADIRLTGELTVKGSGAELPDDKSRIPAYYIGQVHKASDEEFETLLGHAIPDGRWKGELTINDALCQMKYAKSGLCRLIYKAMAAILRRSERKGKPIMNLFFIYNLPFRAMAKLTNGAVSMEMARQMARIANGHFASGFGRLVKGFFANRRENSIYERCLDESAKGQGEHVEQL